MNPSDANFKGSNKEKLGCRNMAFHRGGGGADKKWNVPISQMAVLPGRASGQTRKRGVAGYDCRTDWVNVFVLLCEDDFPGSSLAGRNPAELKTEESRFWFKCRNDPAKGLQRKAQLGSGKHLNYFSVRANAWLFILFTLGRSVEQYISRKKG